MAMVKGHVTILRNELLMDFSSYFTFATQLALSDTKLRH